MKKIPFFIPHVGCPRECSFCDQRSISGRQVAPTAREVETALKQAIENDKSLENTAEIAFFGGSFTAIPKAQRDSYLEAAKTACQCYSLTGIRFSTRPDCIDEKILAELKPYPINRIELGAQSMDNRVLELNNRGHLAEDTIRAAKLIKAYGIKLTLQMMIGLYGDDEKGAFETARKLISLQPDEVRIYPTLVLENTKLAESYRNGQYEPLTLTKAVEISSQLLEMFENKGIKVIRLGLQQEKGLSENLLAGPHHPAFRELAEGLRLFRKTINIMGQSNKTQAVLLISPKDVSKFTGHGGWIMKKFETLGYSIKIQLDEKLERNQLFIL